MKRLDSTRNLYLWKNRWAESEIEPVSVCPPAKLFTTGPKRLTQVGSGGCDNQHNAIKIFLPPPLVDWALKRDQLSTPFLLLRCARQTDQVRSTTPLSVLCNGSKWAEHSETWNHDLGVGCPCFCSTSRYWFWLNVFHAELSPKRCWRDPRWWGKKETVLKARS